MLDKLFQNSFHRIAYSCDQIHSFIYDYLENALPPLTSFRFHLHLNTCLECREFLYLYEKASKVGKWANQIESSKIEPPKEMLKATLEFLQKEGIVENDIISDPIQNHAKPDKKPHE